MDLSKPEPPACKEVRYEYTALFPQILDRLNATLLVSTYQAGKLVKVGVKQGRLSISFCHFDRAMGLACDADRIAVGTRRQVNFLHASHAIARQMPAEEERDGCWTPRTSFYTSNIHGHDLAFGDDGLWVVNTLFSCLCTLHENFSFVPRWKPPFISTIAAQDRCHLNGLALDHGQPRFVTCMAQTDEPAGWRATKATSGCVLDIASGEVVSTGYAMPHSPRFYNGRLFVLNSGHGSLGTIDLATGHYETIEAMPGYTRGLCVHGQYAFVGLSKIRETAIFGGMPIQAKKEELRCGVGIVDLVVGRTVAVFQFHSGVDEIFAVELIPGMKNPFLQGPLDDRLTHDKHETQDVWIVPPESKSISAQHERPNYARPRT